MSSKKMSVDVASGIVSETYKTQVLASRDVQVLKGYIVDAEQSLDQVMDNEADDAQLSAAREVVKDLSAGYKEAKKNYRAQIVLALHRLKELGAI